MSGPEAIAYWDQRHRREGSWRSGGDLTFDEPTNAMFYIVRLGLLLSILGHHSSQVAPLFLLDAGCGKGWFSRRLAQFGHQIDGVDTSEAAIEQCRGRSGGPRFFQSTLSGWSTPWLYDAVLSVDVLFHLLDDGEWERSLRNLASLVRLTGQLIVSDWNGTGERVYSDRQIVRGRDRYLPVLAECGFQYAAWHPYHFRGSPIGFHVFTRIG